MTAKTIPISKIKYPRRQAFRWVQKRLLAALVGLLADVEIHGREHIPKKGPLVVVGNHFDHLDPAILIHVLPWPIEFIGGRVNPGAPPTTRIFPKMWGYFPVYRGTASTYALKAAEAVLKQDGILGVFPEGGNWAQVLRPARPGAAYLATRTQAPILPVGFDRIENIFRSFKEEGGRAKVTVRIGETFGPFEVSGRGRERREQLDAVGEEIMLRIRDLIPAERHGVFSDDPELRAAAEAVADYPWDTMTEEEFKAGDHL